MKRLVLVALLASCGPLSPTVKTDGGTDHTVTVQGEAEVRTVVAVELDICNSLKDEALKVDCITAIVDLIKSQTDKEVESD